MQYGEHGQMKRDQSWKICTDEKNLLRIYNESESNEPTNGFFKLLNYKNKQARRHTLKDGLFNDPRHRNAPGLSKSLQVKEVKSKLSYVSRTGMTFVILTQTLNSEHSWVG